MAEPAGRLVLNVVKQDCSVASCPYKYGDESYGKKLEERVEKKLKHRVADGNEVRALEKRVKDLELALSRAISWGEIKKISTTDLNYMKNTLSAGKKEN